MARPLTQRLVSRFTPICLLLAFAGARADAAPIRYTFGGEITDTDGSAGVALGTRFTGSFTYDPDQAPTKSTVDSLGTRGSEYDFAPGIGGLSIQVGDDPTLVPPLADGLRAEYWKSGSVNELGFNWGLTLRSHPTDLTLGEAFLILRGRSMGGPNDPLPSLLLLDQFTLREMIIQVPMRDGGVPTGTPLFRGTIDTLEPASVPEPAWTAALLMGAAFWAVRRRRSA